MTPTGSGTLFVLWTPRARWMNLDFSRLPWYSTIRYQDSGAGALRGLIAILRVRASHLKIFSRRISETRFFFTYEWHERTIREGEIAMADFLIGAMAASMAASVYELDPVLVNAGIRMPDLSTEPMSPKERDYFAQVVDYYLEHRPTAEEELEQARLKHRGKHLPPLLIEEDELKQAWEALRKEFVNDTALGSAKPPTLHLKKGELEALALLLRVISCRFGHPVWYGYCVALRMALYTTLVGKARRILRDPENAAEDYLYKLLLRSLDPKDLPLPADPAKRKKAIRRSTPILWDYNPSEKFLRYFYMTTKNHLIDIYRKKGGIWAFDPFNSERHGRVSGDSSLMDTELARLHPDVLDEKILALRDEHQQEALKLMLPHKIKAHYIKTEIQVIALEEMKMGWQSHLEVMRRANKRIKNKFGPQYELTDHYEKKLYWICLDQTILRYIEKHGADLSFGHIYLELSDERNEDFKMDPKVRARMELLLE
jgi:hypothetical protein